MEKQDNHGRMLAHVFLPDGTNVQQRLLQQGLAWWVAIPPNIRLLYCYQSAEQAAKNNGLGIWGGPFYSPVQADKPQTVLPGYQLLQGKVTHIRKTRKNIWVNFNDVVVLRIAQSDRHHFSPEQIESYEGKRLLARGWVYRHKNRMVLRVRHPAVIEVLD